jgi:hypothetical protein
VPFAQSPEDLLLIKLEGLEAAARSRISPDLIRSAVSDTARAEGRSQAPLRRRHQTPMGLMVHKPHLHQGSRQGKEHRLLLLSMPAFTKDQACGVLTLQNRKQPCPADAKRPGKGGRSPRGWPDIITSVNCCNSECPW